MFTSQGIKTFNFPKCRDAMFSHQGHMLACAYENLITIISVFSFNIVITLKVRKDSLWLPYF